VILESIGESSATVGALVEGYVALQGVSIRSNLASLTFSFVGSDGDSAWVSGIRYSVDGGDTMLDSGASIPGDPGATGAYTAAVYVSVAEETSGVSRSGVLTVSGSGQTLEFTVSQSAGVKTYGPVEILSLTAADVPASGGSVTSGSVSYRQTYGWNGATSGAGTITSGGSVSWSGGASGIGSLGTTVKDRSVVGSPLVVTVALNDQVGSSSVAIYQAANVSTLTGISADTLSYDAIPVLGGSSSPYYSISGSYSYTSGSTSTSVIDSVVRSRMRAATAATKSFAFVAPVAGFTIDSDTGVVSATETEQTSEKVAQVKMSVAYEGFSSSVTGTCLQPAGSVVYGTPTIALSYATAPAGGGTLSPVFSVTQPWGWNNDTEAGVLSYDLESLPDGSSVNFTTTAGTVGSEDGSITVPTKGTTESGVTTYATISCAVTVNGVSGSGTAAVSQAANTKALTDVSIERNGSGALVTSFTAAGGTAYYKPVGVYTYTSTSTQTVELDSEVTEDNWSLDQAWGSVAANPTYPWCSVVTINSRGTAIGNSRSAVLKLTVGGLSDSVVLTQGANNVERVAITTGGGVDDPLQTQFSAAGYAFVAAAWAYYTSNAKQEIQDATFDNWTISGSGFLMTADPNFGYAVDVGVENRGTTVGPERSATISFEYSGKSDSITLTQEANEQKQTACSIEIDHDYQDPLGYNNTNVPAAGGRVCIVGVRHYSYTSGATSQIEYDSFTLNCNQSWCVPDDASNLTISSRGTVTGSDRSATVYWQDGSCKSNEMTITQKANQITVTTIIKDNGNSPDLSFEASGGWTGYVARAVYSSGATSYGRDLSGWSFDQSWGSLAINNSGQASQFIGLTVQTRGTEEGSARTGTLKTTYGIGASITITQKANTATYGIPTGRTLSVSDIPASGGTISSGTLGGTITQTRTFSSGASDTITNPTVTSSSYSAGVSNGSLGNTVVPRTKKGTLTYSYVCNGKTGSVSADVYQQANSETTITYGVPVVSLSVSDIPASGGTVSSGTVTYTQTRVQNYTSGGTRGLSNVTSGGSISYSTAVSASSKGTTVSARSKVGTLTATVTLNGQKGSGTADVYQEANIQYDKRTVLHFDNFAGPASKTVSAAGGEVFLSLEVVRGYTSGAEGNSVDVTNNALSSFSASGTGFSISPSYKALLVVDNRGTTVGSERSGTVTGTWNGLTSPAIVCTQEANAVTNSNYNPRITAYGTPTVSIGSGMTAAGGSATVSHSVTNTQTYNALYTSGATGPDQTRSVAGTTTISITSNGNNAFSLSGNTLSHRDMATTLATDSVTITAKNSGDTSKTKTASTSITNSRQATGSSGGVTTYGNVIAGTITNKTIPASGGSATATAGNGSQSWSKTAVVTTYTYTSGDTKPETTTAASSGNNTIAPSVSSITANASSKGKTVSGQTTVKTQAVTWSGSASKSASGTMYIYQAANSLKSYSNVLINQFGYNDIPYSAGTSSPVMDITYDVTYDSGTYRDEHGLPSGYSRTFTISGSGFSINASSGVVTAQANPATNTRSATVTATIKNSSGAAVTSATAKVTQAAKPGPVDIYITTSFDYASSQIKINFSTGPKDTFFIKFMGYDQFGSIWEGVSGFTPSSETSFTYAPSGYSITDQFSIEGIGSSEYTISPSSPYETSNARYYWSSTFMVNK
jgi:hypothetical protein